MYQVLQEASEHEASESRNWSTATRNIARVENGILIRKTKGNELCQVRSVICVVIVFFIALATIYDGIYRTA